MGVITDANGISKSREILASSQEMHPNNVGLLACLEAEKSWY
jgi:hypothetical protein